MILMRIITDLLLLLLLNVGAATYWTMKMNWENRTLTKQEIEATAWLILFSFWGLVWLKSM